MGRGESGECWRRRNGAMVSGREGNVRGKGVRFEGIEW